MAEVLGVQGYAHHYIRDAAPLPLTTFGKAGQWRPAATNREVPLAPPASHGRQDQTTASYLRCQHPDTAQTKAGVVYVT